MKIVHLCLGCFYVEGYSYQENLLPKYQKEMGYEIEIIASLDSFDENGHPICLQPGIQPFLNEHGIRVTRLNYRNNDKVTRKLKLFDGLERALELAKPDILFIHGCQFLDMPIVVSYLEAHREVQVFVDNHADYSNSATSFFSKYFLHRIIWRRMAKKILPYTQKFWGVLPARVDFLVENYGVPEEKCSLLVMGADDSEVLRASAPEIRTAVRARFGIDNGDSLIVFGGKIDQAKMQVFNLIEAVLALPENVKLLIFGPVDTSLKDRFTHSIASEKIHYVSWANTSESYDYFSAADVVCFPGRHSVYWEQSAAMGKPLIVKRWPGTEHVDICGNVVFLDRDSTHEIEKALASVLEDAETGGPISQAAKMASGHFMYSDISKRAIGQD